MAQIVEFVGNDPDSGKLFTLGSDVVVATAASVAPATNRKSIFAASFSGVAVGEYQFIALDGAEGDAIWTVAITSADGVFTAYERTVNTSAGASNGTVTRSLTDTEPIQFAWPVTGATLTGEVDFNSANDYQAVSGTFDFLYTEGGVHYYTLAHNAADRPTTEGTARYKVTDGVRTKWFNLRMAVSSSGGGGGTESDLMVSTTIATLASQTSFTLTAGSADNDAYNRQLVVITDSATSTQKARGIVSDYVGSSKTVTLTSAPAFTIAAGDSISIIAIGSDVSSTQVLSAVSSAIVSAGITTTVTGMPTFLRVGDARTVANGGAIPVRLYNVDDDSLLFGLGENLFEDATITFSLRRAGTDVTEGVEDAAIPCTWVEDGADGYVQIAYEADALDLCDAMDRLKEKDCHRWGIKFQWGTDDPITPIYGNISVLRKIVTTQS